jgi:hypothetical protein
MRRLLLLSVLGVVGACQRDAAEGSPDAPTAPTAEASSGTAGAARSFGDWSVSCDNVGDCTAFGFVAETEPTGPFVRIVRAAGGAGEPVIHISTGEPETPPASEPDVLTVVVDGPAPASFTLPRDASDEPAGYMGRAAPADAVRLAEALGNGRALRVSAAGLPVETVSLNGAAAALLWIDERQGRVGTRTALRAKGDSSAVPAPRPVPTVRRAAAGGRDAGAALPRPANLLTHPEVVACREDSGQAPELITGPLGAEANLYAVPCYSGAYNTAFRVFVSGADGTGLRSAPIDGLAPDEDGALMNLDFDPASLTLSEFNKGRGVGDCGVARSWTWDGSRFRLTEESRMELCRGLEPGLWPVLHRTEVR